MWIYTCVVISVVICSKGYGQITGGCPEQLGLPNCTWTKLTEDDCSPEKMLDSFPFYETNTTKFPGRPGSFIADASYRKYKNGIWYPAVNLTFTPPQNVGMNYLKGFEVTRYDVEGKQTCYILDLSNVMWDENSMEKMNTMLWLDLYPLNPKPYPLYRFELYPLPKQANRENRFDHYLSLNLEYIGYADLTSTTASNWRATLSVSKDNDKGTINVTIATPPEEFGFTLFEYNLLENTTGVYNIIKTENRRQLFYEFKGVASGTYKIQVKPLQDGANCPCNIENALPGACHGHCLTTETRPFNFTYTGTQPPAADTSPPPVHVPVTKPPGNVVTIDKETVTTTDKESVTNGYIQAKTASNDVSSTKVAVAIIGSIMGLVLVVLIIVLLYNRRCKHRKEEEMKDKGEHPDLDGSMVLPGKNPGYADDIASIMTFPNLIHVINNGNAEKKQLEKKPKLCLLYEDDHQYHRAVVNHFATYLQQHCQCVSMCVEWQLDAPWVHEDLDQADYVIIVNSEGAYSSYMTKFGQQVFDKSSPLSRRMSSINSVRNKFLCDERYDNIVMVYFDYTDEKFILPDLCQGYKYRLLKHFPEFLLHIHKLHRTDNLSQYDLPFDGNHNKRPIGQKLIESIAEAEQFQQQNPKWLQKRLKCFDRMWSTVSDESKFDSGITDDYNSPGNTPQNERSPPFYTTLQEARLIERLEGNSVLTVNPSDIGLAFQPKQSNVVPETAFVPNHTKPRPKLLPHSFMANQQKLPSHLPTPPTCSSVEDEFAFIPPEDFDDNFDVLSKTQSEQMKSIVDRYQAINTMGTSHEHHYAIMDPTEGYDKSRDLLLLQVQSGEVPFIPCNGEVISLGGESV